MEQKKYFFAVDLGATSGRTILGSLSDGKFDLEELTRFDNRLIEPAITSTGISLLSSMRSSQV